MDRSDGSIGKRQVNQEQRLESLQALIGFAIHASLFLMVLAVGIDTTIHDLFYVLRQPGLLLRSLLAIVVVVPAVAVLVVQLLPLAPAVKAGIVLMAVSPVPPLIPGKELKLGGRKPFVYGLLVAVSLCSIVTVPLSVVLLAAFFSNDAAISPGAVARLMLMSIILPLAIGIAVRRVFPRMTQRGSVIVSRLATILLVLGGVPALIALWPAVTGLIGNGIVISIAVVTIAGLAAGHLLGGPDASDRSALAISSASRHPGIAMLIAKANAGDPIIAPVILLFLIVGIVTALPYQIWFKRHHAAMP